MKTARVSVTVPQELIDEARALVGKGHLSAYVTQGLERQLRADRLARFLSDMDRELGPVPAEDVAAVRQEWHHSV